jgi:predicted hotdog family 3-hydroxylacyl-ACP dehydratase
VTTRLADAAHLLPHRGVARLLTDVVRCDAGEIHARGRVPAAHPLASGAEVPALVAIELGAQAAAAMEALARTASGARTEPRTGSLVRVREARFEREALPVDTTIDVTARLDAAAGPLAIYDVTATLAGTTVMRATISTHAGPAGGRP